MLTQRKIQRFQKTPSDVHEMKKSSMAISSWYETSRNTAVFARICTAMHPQSRRIKTLVVMLDGRRRIRDRERIMNTAVSRMDSMMRLPVVMPCARGLRGTSRTLNVPDSAKENAVVGRRRRPTTAPQHHDDDDGAPPAAAGTPPRA